MRPLPPGETREQAYKGWRGNFYTLWVAEVSAIIGFQAVQPFLPYYVQEFAIDYLAEALVWAGRMGTTAGPSRCRVECIKCCKQTGLCALKPSRYCCLSSL